jgi:hypothetical protein
MVLTIGTDGLDNSLLSNAGIEKNKTRFRAIKEPLARQRSSLTEILSQRADSIDYKLSGMCF